LRWYTARAVTQRHSVIDCFPVYGTGDQLHEQQKELAMASKSPWDHVARELLALILNALCGRRR